MFVRLTEDPSFVIIVVATQLRAIDRPRRFMSAYGFVVDAVAVILIFFTISFVLFVTFKSALSIFLHQYFETSFVNV
jgi:hypothetical protein